MTTSGVTVETSLGIPFVLGNPLMFVVHLRLAVLMAVDTGEAVVAGGVTGNALAYTPVGHGKIVVVVKGHLTPAGDDVAVFARPFEMVGRRFVAGGTGGTGESGQVIGVVAIGAQEVGVATVD